MLRDFTRDPLTGLSNLIKAVERKDEVFRGSTGALIVFDLIDLGEVNRRWGRDVGDRVINGLSHAIQVCASSMLADAEAFRLSGDDFLLSARDMRKEDVHPFVLCVEKELAAYTEGRRLPMMTFRYASVNYPDDVQTLPAAFVHLYRDLSRTPSAGGADWMEALVEKLFQDFAETIDQLKFAHDKALTDDISGLANHRAAEQLLESLLARYYNDQHPFAILFVDGDNLKQYNEMGYDRGNELIKRLGATIRASIRAGDSVFRWLSGDEFLVVLPGVDRSAAEQIGERVCLAVAKAFSHWTIPVTVSVGVAACPQDAQTVDELIRCASRANAEAKQMGKNRVS